MKQDLTYAGVTGAPKRLIRLHPVDIADQLQADIAARQAALLQAAPDAQPEGA